MDLLVVCAACQTEFKASGDERFWKCPKCGRDVENQKYPFLTRKIAHAKSHRKEANWETLFDELLSNAREKVIDLEGRVRRLEEENQRLKSRKPGS